MNNYPGLLADMISDHGIRVAVKLADNPERRLQMSRSAVQLAGREFGRAKLADEFVDAIELCVQP